MCNWSPVFQKFSPVFKVCIKKSSSNVSQPPGRSQAITGPLLTLLPLFTLIYSYQLYVTVSLLHSVHRNSSPRIQILRVYVSLLTHFYFSHWNIRGTNDFFPLCFYNRSHQFCPNPLPLPVSSHTISNNLASQPFKCHKRLLPQSLLQSSQLFSPLHQFHSFLLFLFFLQRRTECVTTYPKSSVRNSRATPQKSFPVTPRNKQRAPRSHNTSLIHNYLDDMNYATIKG